LIDDFSGAEIRNGVPQKAIPVSLMHVANGL
jgi:hypothetical protein